MNKLILLTAGVYVFVATALDAGECYPPPQSRFVCCSGQCTPAEFYNGENMNNEVPPDLIKKAMAEVGHTRDKMAADLSVSRSSVNAWLAPSGTAKSRPMHPELFSRYLSKHGLIKPKEDWKGWQHES